MILRVLNNVQKLRIGGRTIDLSLSADAFRNELYASTVAGSLADLTFAGTISHRAVLKQRERRSEEQGGGTEEALAALRSSLASFEQEKQASQANISDALLPLPKNRFDAAKKHKRMLSGGGTSGISTPRQGPAPTSAYTSEAEVKLQAMKTPVVHLLAIKPASTDNITSTTHVPKEDLESILQKIAKQVNGKWQLGDRAYKDLDVWKFGYPSKEDRQSAIDNAVRAYDRLRIGKEEKIWQNLLPKAERGKGVILSRLHSGGQLNRGLTPSYGQSPMPNKDTAADSRAASTANTPRIGASTPRPTSSKGDVMKRLLSKDPKKARAVQEEKEKKRKEREAARDAAASDREGARAAKRQTTKSANPKIKSAEIVHSSEDESGEEGEVREKITRVDSKNSPEKLKPSAAATKPKLTATSASPDSSDNQTNIKKTAEGAKKRTAADPAKSIASLASKTPKPTNTTGKATPRSTNGLSAPNSQHKGPQRSPQKPDSRPSVPSPLGAARPRVASDVSDRSALGVQKLRQGAGTPQGSAINGISRKRQDTVTSTASYGSSSSDKKAGEDMARKKAPKPTSSGTGTPKVNGITHKVENGLKRKTEDAPSDTQANKHRKTESTSSQSQKSHASSSTTTQNTALTSPEIAFDSGSSDSAPSVLDSITYTQGVSLAEKFSKDYYPAYAAMYDAQAAKQAKGEEVTKDERDRLWAMHRRLEQMKREIQIASQREHRED